MRPVQKVKVLPKNCGLTKKILRSLIPKKIGVRPKTDPHLFICYLVIGVICRFEGHGLEFCVHFAGSLRTKGKSSSQFLIVNDFPTANKEIPFL